MCDLWLNTLRWRQNGRQFPDDKFKCISFDENVWISLKMSMKFVPKVRINNITSLVLIMAWCGQATSHYLNQWWFILLTHICVTWPRWVNSCHVEYIWRIIKICFSFLNTETAQVVEMLLHERQGPTYPTKSIPRLLMVWCLGIRSHGIHLIRSGDYA